GRVDGSGLAVSMLFRDPLDHTRLRALVSKAFTPRVVETLRGRIQAIVDEPARASGRPLADGRRRGPGLSVAGDGISELLGVPLDDGDTVKAWSRDVARTLDALALPVGLEVIERGRRTTDEMAGYSKSLSDERRRHPGPDLLSGLVEAEEAGTTCRSASC